MTQLYYTKKFLPQHLKELQAAKRKTKRKHILQEDNDPSHGTRSTLNYAQLYRKRHEIQSLRHLDQSPDLNPMEAVWKFLKQRIRKRWWKTKEDLKKVLLEWAEISQEQIQAEIDKITERYACLVDNDDKDINPEIKPFFSREASPNVV